ncbi:hypothetical protein AVEN_29479-1 [Araneus ventricosus]|uniref:Uncharacterized protein n=1 Tax=Araneus ventricosus TaxID=182803 RepID=A0A4Y2K2Q7_ARAVE|nr:hypothetical protein AVEN_29479-1 [Araneus ventricosus]
MILSLEQRIFLVLAYHRLEHSYFQTSHCFQRIFDVRRGQSDDAIKGLFEKFERKRNVNDDRIGNVGLPRSAVTESNADVTQHPTAAPDIRLQTKYLINRHCKIVSSDCRLEVYRCSLQRCAKKIVSPSVSFKTGKNILKTH